MNKRAFLTILLLQFSNIFAQNIEYNELDIRQKIVSNINNIFKQYFNHFQDDNIYDKLKLNEENFNLNYSSINLIPNTRNYNNANDVFYNSYDTIKKIQSVHTRYMTFEFHPKRLTLINAIQTSIKYSYEGIGIINCIDKNGFIIRDSLELNFTIIFNLLSQEFKIESLVSSENLPYYILLLNGERGKNKSPLNISIYANNKLLNPLENNGYVELYKFNDKYALKVYSDTLIKLSTNDENYTVFNKIRIQGTMSNVLNKSNEFNELKIRKIIEVDIGHEIGKRNFKIDNKSSVNANYSMSLCAVNVPIKRSEKFNFSLNLGYFDFNLSNIYQNVSYVEHYNHVDQDGDSFIGKNIFSSYKEDRNYNITGPTLGINFRYLIGKNTYIESTNNIHVGLNTSVSITQVCEYLRKGTYSGSLYNVQISENGIYNFGYHYVNHTEHLFNFEPSMSSINSTLGLGYKLSKNAHLAMGCSLHQVKNNSFESNGFLFNDDLSLQGSLFNMNVNKFIILGMYYKLKIRI